MNASVDRLLDKGHPIGAGDRRGRGETARALAHRSLGRLAATGDRRPLQVPEAGRRWVVVAAQDQADVGVGDKAARLVEHKSVARLSDMDRRDHIPDQLEIDHSNCHAIAVPSPGYCNRHVRFGPIK